MRLLKTCSAILLALSLSACVAVPVVDQEEASASSCKTYTKSMLLKAVQLNPNCGNLNECLAVMLTVSAGSVIISGSIVLTNNTVHWLEYQGTCSNGYLNAIRQEFIDSFNKPKPPPRSGQSQ
jgi:hypothetical protein